LSPEEKRAAIIHASLISQFSGPLPPPEELAKYDRILPGSADRIIRMAEQQSMHRQNLESVVLGANASSQKWGLICAFIIAMSAIWGGVWISLKGMSGAGLTTIITALAALVGVFVYGKSQQRKELRDKEQALVPTQPSSDDQPAKRS
jgi:uncharacterized membrane protein